MSKNSYILLLTPSSEIFNLKMLNHLEIIIVLLHYLKMILKSWLTDFIEKYVFLCEAFITEKKMSFFICNYVTIVLSNLLIELSNEKDEKDK